MFWKGGDPLEIVIGLAVVIALLIALGVSPYYIMEGVMILLMLTLYATLLFFVITAFSFIGSKRRTGKFDRIDRPEGKAFPSAVYISEGEELRNAFPNEFVLKKVLYKQGEESKLLVTKRGKIYDKYSLITVFAGLVLGTASAVFLTIRITAVIF